MNERIHEVLDGERSRDTLSREELTRLVEYESTFAAARAAVPEDAAPDLVAGVMARIAELQTRNEAAARSARRSSERSGLRAALGWLWTPRPIALRPAWGLAGAAALFVLMLNLPSADIPASAPVAAVSAQPEGAVSEIYVHFRLDAPAASSVHLAGDFTEWEPSYELHQTQPGVWTVVVPLEAGVHDYAFVVDGEVWTPDPLATRVDDGFGGENSRLSLLPPERIRA